MFTQCHSLPCSQIMSTSACDSLPLSLLMLPEQSKVFSMWILYTLLPTSISIRTIELDHVCLVYIDEFFLDAKGNQAGVGIYVNVLLYSTMPKVYVINLCGNLHSNQKTWSNSWTQQLINLEKIYVEVLINQSGLGKNRSWKAFFSGFPTAPVSLKMCQNVLKCAKNAKNAPTWKLRRNTPTYELWMKLNRQTEADLGFYICFFQIHQSLGSEVTPWSRGWSGCYADFHTFAWEPKIHSRRLLARYCIYRSIIP